MDNVWNGSLSPDFVKHRDYAHSNYLDHELANGGRYEVMFPVMVDADPIDGSLFVPSRNYHGVKLTTHTGDDYVYLIPSEPDRSEPNHKRIRDTIVAYLSNPVEGGRNWEDYIDPEESAKRGYYDYIDYTNDSEDFRPMGERRLFFSIDNLLTSA